MQVVDRKIVFVFLFESILDKGSLAMFLNILIKKGSIEINRPIINNLNKTIYLKKIKLINKFEKYFCFPLFTIKLRKIKKVVVVFVVVHIK